MVPFYLRCTLLLLLVVLASSVRRRKPRFMDPVAQIRPASGAPYTISRAAASTTPTYNWTTKWFTEAIDHFDYRNTQNFQLKYLTNYDYFKCGGPIFFYTGNEGSIEGFARNTGIMWDLAPQFNAAIVFAEHRFYGASMPFGNQSYAHVTNLGYLSAIQALADYAELLTYMKFNKTELGCSIGTEIPVIAFGGSYGGMLSAWMRMKYPHIVDGAWASSAPLRYFYETGANEDLADNITTRTFVNSGCDRQAFSKGFAAIEKLSQTDEGRQQLNQIFHAQPGYEMKNSSDFWTLYSYINGAVFYMAMTDYPYPSSFLTNMPGFPAKYACQFAKTAPPNDTELARQLYEVINVYYNYSGNQLYNCFTYNCHASTTGALDAGNGWDWQYCTSITMQMCAMGGDVDFFLRDCPGTMEEFINSEIQNCVLEFENIGYVAGLYQIFGVLTRYGYTYSAASNIIFSNGDLDPWSGGGVYGDSPGIPHAMENGVYIFYMKDSAHHLDLRTPNTCDPPSVISERFQVVNILECWVNSSCTKPPKSYDLPDNSGWKVNNECSYINHGYPWGQAVPKKSWHLLGSTFLTVLASVFSTIKG